MSLTPNRYSLLALIACVTLLYAAGFIYYPKHHNERTESTISWDVSGYYMYLPAIFIYNDLKEQQFLDDIIDRYQPTPSNIQSFKHSSGNYVMKYSAGQAITLSPFYAVGHIWASYDDRYDADGFSFPYQMSLALGCFLIAIIGLIYLRKVLLEFYSDGVTGLVLISIVFGSNYLEYAGISSGMTHNSLFTYYALLLWTTIQFHKQPSSTRALIIGALIGIMALTRPTEIIAAFIPVMWGISGIGWSHFNQRWNFFKQHMTKLFKAILLTMTIGAIQLIYWKYASGDWIVYSYGEEGFSWFSPHIKECMLSYRSGWLVYSLMMIFSLIGLGVLYFKNKTLFYSIIIFTILFMYLCFAWDVWWYGGSLGQRAMVQSYPVLALAIGAFYQWIGNQKVYWRIAVGVLIPLFICLNLYWTHQSHKGGLLYVGQMTKAYFWKVIGTFDKQEEDLKLLDTNYNFDREISKTTDTLTFPDSLIVGTKLDAENQFSSVIRFDRKTITRDWIRIAVDVESPKKEWDLWRMTQLVCK